MLMIGAPATFFSLLKNLTDIYVISEKNSVGRKLQVKTITTSVITVFLAIVAGFIVAAILSAQLGDLSGDGGLDKTPTLQELIESLVPSSIFVPFETIMPFPLIFVALIVTYAFCTIGKYFDKMKEAVDACYTLFSRMLHVVMFAFPFFCFLALMYPLLGSGYTILLQILYIIALSAASLVILAAFYLVRLLIGGVKLRPFLKHLPALLKENYTIGTMIIALFLKADVLIPTAVYLEVFFGAIQNLINVTGDVVTVAIEEKHVWK